MNTEQQIRKEIDRAKVLFRMAERNKFSRLGTFAVDMLSRFPIEIYLLADQEVRAEQNAS